MSQHEVHCQGRSLGAYEVQGDTRQCSELITPLSPSPHPLSQQQQQQRVPVASSIASSAKQDVGRIIAAVAKVVRRRQMNVRGASIYDCSQCQLRPYKLRSEIFCQLLKQRELL